jgi:hypothetical protein
MKNVFIDRFSEKLEPQNISGKRYFAKEDGVIMTNENGKYVEAELPEADSYSGNTYPVKDSIKAKGFRWNGHSKTWRCPDYDAKQAAEAEKEMDELLGEE